MMYWYGSMDDILTAIRRSRRHFLSRQSGKQLSN